MKFTYEISALTLVANNHILTQVKFILA